MNLFINNNDSLRLKELKNRKKKYKSLFLITKEEVKYEKILPRANKESYTGLCLVGSKGKNRAATPINPIQPPQTHIGIEVPVPP